ncbi:hypothetical protein ACJX0J_024720, partial [Zea mays]
LHALSLLILELIICEGHMFHVIITLVFISSFCLSSNEVFVFVFIFLFNIAFWLVLGEHVSLLCQICFALYLKTGVLSMHYASASS